MLVDVFFPRSFTNSFFILAIVHATAASVSRCILKTLKF